MSYSDVKSFNGKPYSGMSVGLSHDWIYPNGTWHETKVRPDKWNFNFKSRKTRRNPAPRGSGAEPGSGYHWYIVADQRVRKVDKDSYETLMEGLKFKVGHKRPYWKKWSYEYPEQDDYKKRVAAILEEALKGLKDGEM